MATIRLIAKDGYLYFPHGGLPGDSYSPDFKEPAILVRAYAAGDCDTCPWPMDGAAKEDLERRLAAALYDERESNIFFPSDTRIELPDGAPFDFDAIVC